MPTLQVHRKGTFFPRLSLSFKYSSYTEEYVKGESSLVDGQCAEVWNVRGLASARRSRWNPEA